MIYIDVSLKMGLSGSPFYNENQDSIGDIELINYFGEVIDKYEIKEALADGVLTPYDYHPIKAYLNDDEYDENDYGYGDEDDYGYDDEYDHGYDEYDAGYASAGSY